MKRGEGVGGGSRNRLFLLTGVVPLLFLQAACGVTTPFAEINEMYREVIDERTAEYRLKSGDILRIDLFAQQYTGPEQIQVTVRPDGRGDVLFLPDTQLAGRTVRELREDLGEPIRGQYQDAEFNIEVIVSGEQVILVGQFEEPGTVDLVPSMTLGMAVGAVGGVKVSGKTSSIQLTRPYRDPSNPEVYSIDLYDETGELLLLPGDQVYLGRTFLATLVAYWQEYVLGFVDVRLVFGRGDFGSSN